MLGFRLRTLAGAGLARAVVFSCLAAQVALAEPSDSEKETARALVGEGDRFFSARDYPNALARYASAYRLMHVPTVGIEVAKAQAASGRLIEANATAIEIINSPLKPGEPPVFGEARVAASELSRSLSARIPAVLVDITPAPASALVRIDNVEMPAAIREVALKINPGAHQLSVAAPGYESVQRQFTLKEREQRTLGVALVATVELPASAAAPAPASRAAEAAPGASAQSASVQSASVQSASVPAPSSQDADAAASARTRGYVALGVAGAGALVGGIAGTLAFTSKPDCGGDSCFASENPNAQSDINTSKTFGNVATVGWGVAIVAGAYGLYELLANGKSSDAAVTSSTPSAFAAPALTLAPLGSQGARVQMSGSF